MKGLALEVTGLRGTQGRRGEAQRQMSRKPWDRGTGRHTRGTQEARSRQIGNAPQGLKTLGQESLAAGRRQVERGQVCGPG